MAGELQLQRSLAQQLVRHPALHDLRFPLHGPDSCQDVFDLAVQQDLTPCILDWIQEVCGDETLTSSSPAEAQLLDGTVAHEWCCTTARTTHQQLQAATASERALGSSAAALTQALRHVQACGRVLQALAGIRSRGRRASGSVTSGLATGCADLQHVMRLTQALRLASWYVTHSLHTAPHSGAFASHPDWVRRVHLRRDAAPASSDHAPTLLDALLRALGGEAAGTYPPPSPLRALQTALRVGLEGAGEQQPAAQESDGRGDAPWWDVVAAESSVQDGPDSTWTAALAFLVYYLVDSGTWDGQASQPGGDLASSLSVAVGARPTQLAVWAAAPPLDDAPISARGGATLGLARAATRLLASPPPRLHIRMLEALGAAGHVDAALALHRTQQAGASRAPPLSDDDAWAVVELRLRRGLLGEALACARAAVDDSARRGGGPASSLRRERLLRGVLDWAVEHGRQAHGLRAASVAMLDSFVGAEEEAVLLGWLQDAATAGKPAGALLPVVLAAQGKPVHALAAYQRLAALTGGGALPAGATAAVDAALEAAVGGLPLPLRALQVATTGDQSAQRKAGADALLSGFRVSLVPGMPLAELQVRDSGVPLVSDVALPDRTTSAPAAPAPPAAAGLTATAAPVAATPLLAGLPAGGSAAPVGGHAAGGDGGVRWALGRDALPPPVPVPTASLLFGAGPDSRQGAAAAPGPPLQHRALFGLQGDTPGFMADSPAPPSLGAWSDSAAKRQRVAGTGDGGLPPPGLSGG